jgi:disulfide bond formation protein DsbB
MSARIIKILKISIISLVVLLLASAGTVAGIYYYGIRQNKPIEAVGKITLEPEKVRLGEEVTATLLLKCPWHRKITEAVAQPAQGTSLCDEPQIKRQSLHWGYSIEAVKVKFKSYRTGNIPAGKLNVSFNRYDDKTTDLNGDFIIPPFKCVPLSLKKTQNIVIADAIKPPKKINKANTWLLIGIAVLVIILIVILIFQRRKKVKKIVLPSWAIALNDLHNLRDSIKSGKISLNNGFINLTDIVRGYLEKRFKLPASKQTTEEFLNQMNQKDGPLPEIQRPFLQEFMQAAELVKFAKLPPDESMLNKAMGKAETLVNETRPSDEDNRKTTEEKAQGGK